MINVAQSASFESIYESGESGLLPGLEVAIFDNDGNVVFGPTDSIITENDVGGQPTGVYSANFLAAPATLGQYTIIWSNDGTFDPNAGAGVEDLIVLTAAEAAASLPAIPTDDDGGLLWGPCTSWATAEEMFDFCSSAVPESSNPEEMIPQIEATIAAASQFLWAASGRQFAGLCQRTVRPCRTGCTCDWQVLSRGHIVASPDWSGTGSWLCDGTPCGCSPLSEVKLAGYPVREIIDVRIDGESVSADEYALRERRLLVRLNGARWPACQSMDVGDDDDGAFAVTYTYGQSAPELGKQAALQLCMRGLQGRTRPRLCVARRRPPGHPSGHHDRRDLLLARRQGTVGDRSRSRRCVPRRDEPAGDHPARNGVGTRPPLRTASLMSSVEVTLNEGNIRRMLESPNGALGRYLELRGGRIDIRATEYAQNGGARTGAEGTHLRPDGQRPPDLGQAYAPRSADRHHRRR